MISPSQCRAARGLLDWSQLELAKRSRVGIVTIRQLEGGLHQPRPATLQVVRQALESAGVEFIDENGGGAGVRLRKPGEPKSKKK
jgi:transcriptional regulator with XRE-family HTH domain